MSTPNLAQVNNALSYFTTARIKKVNDKMVIYNVIGDVEYQISTKLVSDRSTLYHDLPGEGGTNSARIAMMINWLEDKPRYPAKVYKHIKEGMLTDFLQDAGYDDPAKTNCFMCGEPITSSFDWWKYGCGCEKHYKDGLLNKLIAEKKIK